MNQRSIQRIRERAIKAGAKKASKLHHPLDREEILKLRVQTVSLPPRVLVGLAGAGLIAAAANGWPWDENRVRAILAIVGILFTLFGIFGFRRTLESLGDALGDRTLELIIELIFRIEI